MSERTDLETPEELLKEEIEDLERPMLHAWLPWVVSLSALVVLSGILAFFFFVTPRASYRGPRTASGLPVMTLAEPQGHIKAAPPTFRWYGVDGAQTYVVTVIESDSSRAILIRPAEGITLEPTDVKASLFKPGLYTWTVEARGADGTTLAAGEAAFVLEGT
jgi:hypothetical protein